MNFSYELDVLSFNSRSYTAKDGSARTFRSVLVNADGTVVQFPVGKDVEEISKGKHILVFEVFTFGDSIAPMVRVVGVDSDK